MCHDGPWDCTDPSSYKLLNYSTRAPQNFGRYHKPQAARSTHVHDKVWAAQGLDRQLSCSIAVKEPAGLPCHAVSGLPERGSVAQKASRPGLLQRKQGR
jgi:hypothetical protein